MVTNSAVISSPFWAVHFCNDSECAAAAIVKAQKTLQIYSSHKSSVYMKVFRIITKTTSCFHSKQRRRTMNLCGQITSGVEILRCY